MFEHFSKSLLHGHIFLAKYLDGEKLVKHWSAVFLSSVIKLPDLHCLDAIIKITSNLQIIVTLCNAVSFI